ncbi:MAG: PEP-utilizing enzyme, partial [Nanoarchaeota archaeon]
TKNVLEFDARVYFHFENGSFVLKEDTFPEFLHEERSDQTSMLHGHGTFPTKITGVVRIIHTPKELEQLQEGEIVVLRMTLPSLPLYYIQKAKAIITDEGGITCHAAVISREFGIPALMGTKNATTTFQTGDLVHVDTAQGVAYKLGPSQPEEHTNSTEKS